MSEKKSKAKKKKQSVEIVKSDNELISIPKCQPTATSLVFDPNITEEEFIKVGDCIKRVDVATKFWIGDWINFGKDKFQHGKYSKALKIYPYSYGTLANIASVCEKIEPSRRRGNLNFSHHQEVAPLSEVEQEYWLDKAEKEGLSAEILRNKIRAKRIEEKLKMSEVRCLAYDHKSGNRSFSLIIERLVRTMDKLRTLIWTLVAYIEEESLDCFEHEIFPPRWDKDRYVEVGISILSGLYFLLGEEIFKFALNKDDLKMRKKLETVGLYIYLSKEEAEEYKKRSELKRKLKQDLKVV